MEVEHFLLSKIALQVLSDADGTYSHRGTREQQVTDFQGHEATDIGNDIIYPEQHIRCMATLHLLIINRQMEVQILYIAAHLFQRDKGADSCRIVETFANSHGLPASRNLRCKSRAVKSMPTVTAS